MNFKKLTQWTRFNRYLYKYWKLQAVVIVLGLIMIPVGLLNPYLTKLVIDKAYGNKDLRLFFILALIGSFVFIVSGLINALSSYISRWLNRKVNFNLSMDLFKHLQYLPMSFFDNHSTGEHIYRVNADVRSVTDFVCNTVPQMITIVPRFLFIFIIVFSLNWKIALLAVLLVPISYIHPYFFGKRIKEVMGSTIIRSQGIYKYLQEKFSHIHLIKAMGKEQYEIEKFKENMAQRMAFELKNARLVGISGFSGAFLSKVIGGIIALYGGYQVIAGTMTLGSLTAIMIYLTQMMGLLTSIGTLYQSIIINSVTRHRLEEVLDITSTTHDKEDAIKYDITKGHIEFRNVYFGYKKNQPVLDNMSFNIEAGSHVAFVGLSGCGKTTMLSLILRLYELEKGTILIDGVDIDSITLESLKSSMSLVLQEPFLWNDSIFNNILYGAEGATHDEVVKAAQLAEADDFIMKLPNKYDSVIGEMACKISEGQKQRIAVARALIRKPKIMILDEAMSSLDSETEDKVMNNIKREFKDSTIIVVSHRLSTVKKMDSVYFLKDGATIKTTTHEDLVKNDHHYRDLFASQIEKYEPAMKQ